MDTYPRGVKVEVHSTNPFLIGSIVTNTRFFFLVLAVVVFNLAAFAASVVLYNVPIWAVFSVIIGNVVMMVTISKHTTVSETTHKRLNFNVTVR